MSHYFEHSMVGVAANDKGKLARVAAFKTIPREVESERT